MDIILPKISLRPYQRIPYDKVVHEGCKRMILVWARRSGKDMLGLSIMVARAMMEKGLYFYCLPTYTQASNVIWKGKTNEGRNMVEANIPNELIAKKNSSDMTIELINGSIIKVVGSDNYDRLVGSNPKGILFSEYSLADPRGWDLMRPILSNNDGFAIFIYTPRGYNHGKTLFDTALNNPEWYVSKLTYKDTGSATDEDIQRERESGMPENLIRQEYMCDFTASNTDSYFGNIVEAMRKDGRICTLPIDYSIPVCTSMDLGYNDQSVIIFYQRYGEWIHIIDYWESSGCSLQDYAKIMMDKGYIYDKHYFPSDIMVHDLGTGETRLSMLQKMGIVGTVLPKKSLSYGIECIYRLLPRTKINVDKCERLIKCLSLYSRKYDEKNDVFLDTPVHNSYSHGVDGIRYAAIAERERYNTKVAQQSYIPRPQSSYNPFGHLK